MKRFDIVLVLAHFRAATAYLSIIRHLSARHRIAVLPATIEAALQKTGEAQQVFLELCRKLGAEILEQATPVQTALMLVQQFPYPEQTVLTVRSNIEARKTVGFLGFATGGLEKHDSSLAAFGITKVYVPSERFLRFLIQERKAASRFAVIQVVEVGLPFKQYPIFPEFTADYIVAAPTVFSFHTEAGKQHFLKTILRLFEQIPSAARILYKTHNGSSNDYFAPKLQYALARVLRHLPGACTLLDWLTDRVPRVVQRRLQPIQTSVMHLRILDRAKPIASATPYADISLEAFLPGVRGGVIGGLSNTIWGTLYFELPFYNCVDSRLRAGKSDLLPHRSSDTLLDLNLRYFGVPYCDGQLARGVHGEDIVTEQDRRGDLIQAVMEDLKSA